MNVDQYEISCNTCGVTFWITKLHNNKLRRCRNTFYCPNGHTMWYPQQTDAEKFEKLYKGEKNRADRNYSNLQNKRDECNRLGRTVAGYKGAITRARKKNTKKK